MFNDIRNCNKIIEAVSMITDLSVKEIKSKNRRREVVDARHIAIKLIYDSGVYASKIAEIFQMTLRNIHIILTNFDNAIKFNKPMRYNYERVVNKIRNMKEI